VSAAQNIANRGIITAFVMLAVLMNTLDGTIANIALPHMQGGLSAAPDQITWVLSSYFLAVAVMTPMAGWLAGRFGMKPSFLCMIVGFTIASMLCGAATSLPMMVAFRVLQGLCGAAMIPLSQALLLNIYPKERHPQAMSIWAACTILGPIMGPLIGGYITETLNWRWCFYINLPVGIVSGVGVWVFLSADEGARKRAFDFLGFGALALAIAAFQLMLDRGPGEDWFASWEIWAEAVLAVVGLWVFLVHSLTTDHPFFDLALFRDRNLMTASIFNFFIGLVVFSSMAITPLVMQGLMGYPAITAGFVTMPRGVGMMVAILVVGRIAQYVEHRLVLLASLAMSAVAFWQMAHFDLSMDSGLLISSGFLQGFSMGTFFVPLTTLAFGTIDPALRAEASSFYNLIRNLGASSGIAIMQALATYNGQAMHSSLAGRVAPDDPVLRATLPAAFDPASLHGALVLDAEITRQAMMTAYVNDFRLMLLLTFLCVPLILLMRPAKRGVASDPTAAAME
jgi:DHA2 family multidrug resistance protein